MAEAADYKLGEHMFPRGWFMIAEASELGQKPLPLHFFGKDFVLYRGESGKLVLIDAHCPHMGAHFAKGESSWIVYKGQQIEGDSIRCPFHGWRFNAEGKADDIPNLIGDCPEYAKVNSYPVAETLGAVMMWHDLDGGAPDYPPPYLAEWDDTQWINGVYDHLGEVPIHPQEIVDNMSDVNHFGPAHGVPPEYFQNEAKGHLYIQQQGGFRDEYNAYLTTYTWYTGPGLLISHQHIGDSAAYECIFHTPIENGRVMVWHNVLMKCATKSPTKGDHAAQKKMQTEVLSAFSQDFDIWANKKPSVALRALAHERNFRVGRLWYKQFYTSRSKAVEYENMVNGKHILPHLPGPPPEALHLERF
jgi:3-ketosteroid 9alpha-monooxygenase subunit A